jgi:hypothetical protein
MTVSLSDQVSGGITATLDCGGTLNVPADGSNTCGYSASLPDGNNRVNTATATLNGVDFTGEADVTFGDPNNTYNNEVSVDDTNVESWGPVSSSTTWNYTRDFTCSSDPTDYTNGQYSETHDNTATIVETGDSDDASVTKNCFAPVVSKDASPTYTRTYDWGIDKSADQSLLELEVGETADVNYSADVYVTGSIDSDWAVEGTITVDNYHPTEAMTVSLSDTVSPDISATLDCGGSLEIPANSSATCDYSADLSDATSRTNTATATFNEIDFTGTADVVFGEPTSEVDECIDVDDDQYGFLGTVCADSEPQTFNYSTTIGPYQECGDDQFVNVASFATNDTGSTGSDNWTVDITIECVDLGCTLTPGYWKTHSSYGPASYDDTWAQIGEDTPFFLSGTSYYEVINEPNADGNVYYILAQAYIATELNQLAGAYMPTDVLEAFSKATSWFEEYTPDEWAEFKGKEKRFREEIIDAYELLDDYNNGLIGPGHCPS